MDYKTETKKYYDTFFAEYRENNKPFIEQRYLEREYFQFLRMLHGKKILDVGAGYGRDSVYFKKEGYNPLCIDISPSMVKLCQEQGLEAKEMDLEHMNFEKATFDGVWACTSLIHIPKKNLNSVLQKIKEILKPQGAFFVVFKQGNTEGFKPLKEHPGFQRYFSWYSDQEIRTALEKHFHIVSFSKLELDSDHIFLNYLCRPLNL